MKQCHLGVNKNVALNVDKLLSIMLERVEKIRSLSVIKKRAEIRWNCTYLSLHLANVKRLWGSSKSCPFLDIGQQQIMGQVGKDQATWLLIRRDSFRTKWILAECYWQMTGRAMSLVAYGPFTDKMKIFDPKHMTMWATFGKCCQWSFPVLLHSPYLLATGNAT